MARFRRLEVYDAMLRTGLVPLAHHADAEAAFRIADACAAGGAAVFEFTNRGDHALAVFAALEARLARERPRLILGAGSIVDAPTAAAFIGAGAAFIVGPSFEPEVARLCNRRKVAYLPGAATLGEIARAEEAGCEIVKVFPADAAGGPEFITAVAGPCPWTSLMPTGGVTADEPALRAWFGAGAACIGMGSTLIAKDAVASRDWDGIARAVAKAVALIATVRGK
jgi:2-dehydro-3-deoxyphosphogluconate aldolase/(4S)-4-hydroxy-2-oxoglutarate aldolase